MSCHAFPLCGGSEWSPCGCVWNEPSRRHRCDLCPLICRERIATDGATPPERFRSELRAAGMPLDLLRASHPLPPDLPPFIPLRTNELAPEAAVPVPVVGVDLRTLLSRHKGRGADLRPWVKSNPASLLSSLRASPEAKVLAVLSGQDDVLEAFWGTNRRRIASELAKRGFLGATGPTFSVYDSDPSSHQLCMLLRHHRTVQDLQKGGLDVAPNLYWRDHRDRDRWVEWLRRESTVRTVSREFARTKDPNRFSVELAGLIEILQRSERPFHVITAGIGIRKAHLAQEALAKIGCTLTLVAADPVMAAIKHGRALTFLGDAKPMYVRRPRVTRQELAAANVSAAAQYLNRLVDPLTGKD